MTGRALVNCIPCVFFVTLYRMLMFFFGCVSRQQLSTLPGRQGDYRYENPLLRGAKTSTYNIHDTKSNNA